jgi:hypothetical protein
VTRPNIDYNKSFAQHVRGRLQARFLLKAGRPVYEKEGAGEEETRHYEIELSLVGGAPEIDRVIYVLDSSYYDPVREADTPPDFKEEITSYGDYPVEAKVEMGKRVYVQKAWLSDLLLEGHREELDVEAKDDKAGRQARAIREAIAWIEND